MKIAIVRKNADFTEGKGPMLFHKAFTNEQLAHDYIMMQPGIYGSKQGFSGVYGSISNYNGYSIEMVPLEDCILSQQEKEKLAKELREIKERTKEIENLLK